MTILHTVAWADVPPRPWRNGGGVARDLLGWPSADAPAVLVSVAEIERSGPFSPYPGVDRWFTVLAGPGLTLSLPSGRRALCADGEVVRFDGSDAPDCRLSSGPVRALNLLLSGVAGGLWPAQPGALWTRPAEAAALCALFACVPGHVEVDGVRQPLPAMTLLHLSPRASRLRWWPDDLPAGSAPSAVGFPTAGLPTAFWISAAPPRGAGGPP